MPDPAPHPEDLPTGPAADLAIYAARLVRTMRRELDIPAGVRVLSVLDERGPLGLGALAQVDGCAQPTMSARVAQLVRDGLVDRAPDPADGRGTVLTLTDAGRAELGAVRSRIAVAMHRQLAGTHHTGADVETAAAVLRHLVESGPWTPPRPGSTDEEGTV